MVIARPGRSASHQTSRITERPSDTMIPQAGSPGGSPKPKKLNDVMNDVIEPVNELIERLGIEPPKPL